MDPYIIYYSNWFIFIWKSRSILAFISFHLLLGRVRNNQFYKPVFFIVCILWTHSHSVRDQLEKSQGDNPFFYNHATFMTLTQFSVWEIRTWIDSTEQRGQKVSRVITWKLPRCHRVLSKPVQVLSENIYRGVVGLTKCHILETKLVKIYVSFAGRKSPADRSTRYTWSTWGRTK